jgi:N-acyl homoserine lactone hydrolase
MSVLVDEGAQLICIAGDAAYTQDLLIAQTLDGIGSDPLAQQATQRALLQLAHEQPTVFLPSHECDAERRLAAREIIARPTF